MVVISFVFLNRILLHFICFGPNSATTSLFPAQTQVRSSLGFTLSIQPIKPTISIQLLSRLHLPLSRLQSQTPSGTKPPPHRGEKERDKDGTEAEGAAVFCAVAHGGGGGGRGGGQAQPRGEGQRHQQPRRDGHHERAPHQAPGPRPRRRRLRRGGDRPRAAVLLPAEQQGMVCTPLRPCLSVPIFSFHFSPFVPLKCIIWLSFYSIVKIVLQ
jgi:hypothetical protein